MQKANKQFQQKLHQIKKLRPPFISPSPTRSLQLPTVQQTLLVFPQLTSTHTPHPTTHKHKQHINTIINSALDTYRHGRVQRVIFATNTRNGGFMGRTYYLNKADDKIGRYSSMHEKNSKHRNTIDLYGDDDDWYQGQNYLQRIRNKDQRFQPYCKSISTTRDEDNKKNKQERHRHRLKRLQNYGRAKDQEDECSPWARDQIEVEFDI